MEKSDIGKTTLPIAKATFNRRALPEHIHIELLSGIMKKKG